MPTDVTKNSERPAICWGPDQARGPEGLTQVGGAWRGETGDGRSILALSLLITLLWDSANAATGAFTHTGGHAIVRPIRARSPQGGTPLRVLGPYAPNLGGRSYYRPAPYWMDYNEPYFGDFPGFTRLAGKKEQIFLDQCLRTRWVKMILAQKCDADAPNTWASPRSANKVHQFLSD